MTDEHEFPIMLDWIERRDNPDYPRSVPWRFVAPHEKQAWDNHDQSLETLARRGGLHPAEMIAVITGKRWREMDSSAEGIAGSLATLIDMLRIASQEAYEGNSS